MQQIHDMSRIKVQQNNLRKKNINTAVKLSKQDICGPDGQYDATLSLSDSSRRPEPSGLAASLCV